MHIRFNYTSHLSYDKKEKERLCLAMKFKIQKPHLRYWRMLKKHIEQRLYYASCVVIILKKWKSSCAIKLLEYFKKYFIYVLFEFKHQLFYVTPLLFYLVITSKRNIYFMLFIYLFIKKSLWPLFIIEINRGCCVIIWWIIGFYRQCWAPFNLKIRYLY